MAPVLVDSSKVKWLNSLIGLVEWPFRASVSGLEICPHTFYGGLHQVCVGRRHAMLQASGCVIVMSMSHRHKDALWPSVEHIISI